MALRLDPDHPLVWRSPSALQFGVEEPVVVLDSVDAAEEFVLGLVSTGVSRPVLDALAATQRIEPARVSEVLTRLTAVLEAPREGGALAGRVVAVDGGGAVAGEVGRMLRLLGAQVAGPTADEASRAARSGAAGKTGGGVDLAVVLSHYATVPRRAAAWLRADVPHLLVEFGDRSLRVGPVVVPGEGPCATCLELARTDRDPAWPAIAAQAAERTAPSADPLGAATAAVLVARIALHQLGAGSPRAMWRRRAVRIRRPRFDAEGAWSLEAVSAHPRCGCRFP